MAPVDEWRIRDDTDAVIRELEASMNKYELHAVKFNPDGYKVSPEPWDDGFYRPFWEAATALDVPIFFFLGMGPGNDSWAASSDTRDGYLEELNILQRVDGTVSRQHLQHHARFPVPLLSRWRCH